MELICLFIQRKESYTGQYAPELLAAVDCFTNDDNPTWFEDQCQQALKTTDKNDIIGKAIVNIKVDQDKIRAMCLQNDHVIDGITK